MEENKYLKLARQARNENNSDDAKTFYNNVRIEQPDNGEAKYFYAFYDLMCCQNKEIYSKFIYLTNALIPSIQLVAKSDSAASEKFETIGEIVDSFVPRVWALNRFMNEKNHSTKIGNTYVKVFDDSTIKEISKSGMTSLKNLGDEIDKLFPNDPDAKRLSCVSWKEYVSLSQTWWAWAVKGDAEIYAAKIKSVEPAYEMPKRAGCISFGKKQ